MFKYSYILMAAITVINLPVAPALATGEPVPEHPPKSFKVLDIAPAWAGHPVNFSLLTHDKMQFVGFYDADRNLTIGQRDLRDKDWQFKILPTRVGWDSHNSIVMAVDRNGYIHICANMHAVPLIYFRSERPLGIASMKEVSSMTGLRESSVTYPVFINGPGGELIFSYRDGKSGEGDTLYNVYDEDSKTWSRLLGEPILDGGGRSNAYPVGPILGADGFYHLTWVWRDTSAAETNHDLSYARSRDLKNWESAAGNPIQLPITPMTPGVVVDPIPVNGGIINSSGRVGFDQAGGVVITYHKFDKFGNTQLYFARFVDGAWQSSQATDWDYRWNIHGGGSLTFELRHGAIAWRDQKLVLPIQHVKYGSGFWSIDPHSMKLAERISGLEDDLPPELREVKSSFPGMEVRWVEDIRRGTGGSRFLVDASVPPNGKTYLLRWETLGFNRDQPRSKPWPPAAMLQLVEISSPQP